MNNGALALARQKIQQAKKYFQPVADKVRVRDFVREIPHGIVETAKAIPRDMARFGISAAEAPRALRTGQSTGKFYNTPLGRINSFQSEAQNRVRRGDPLWKAIGNPALDTVLAGSDVGAIARPAMRALAGASKMTAPIVNFANDPTMPGRFATAVKNSYLNRQPGRITRESIPAHWVKTDNILPFNLRTRRVAANQAKMRGYGEITDIGFNEYGQKVQKRLPEQVVERGRLTPTIRDFGMELRQALPRPGMTVEDVSRNPLLQEARKYKSAEEFVNSFNLMKSGEVTSIGQLPISKVNKTQIRAITERGLPHTDTGLKVKDFTPGRKVTQPLEVYSKGGSYVVENGNHRLAQALANGDTHIPVVFKRGEGKTYSTHTKSQLTDLWKKAHQGGDSLDPLKYKSAEEFVKAQGEPLYHGSDKAAVIEKEGFKLMPDRGVSAYGDGAYLTTSKSDAKGWGGMVSGYVPKDLKLAKVPSNEPYTVNTKKLIQEGYDGVEVGYGDKQHIVLFDPSKIKTKSQLTDLWKKAHKK